MFTVISAAAHRPIYLNHPFDDVLPDELVAHLSPTLTAVYASDEEIGRMFDSETVARASLLPYLYPTLSSSSSPAVPSIVVFHLPSGVLAFASWTFPYSGIVLSATDPSDLGASIFPMRPCPTVPLGSASTFFTSSLLSTLRSVVVFFPSFIAPRLSSQTASPRLPHTLPPMSMRSTSLYHALTPPTSQSKDISLDYRALLMAESAFQQWLAVSGYCAARTFARLPFLIVLESVASFVTYSQGRPFQQLVGCLLTLPYMLRGQVRLFPPSLIPCPPSPP